MVAIVLKLFNIHFFPLWECGTAGTQILQPFKIQYFPLRECGTAGAVVSLVLLSILFDFNS